MTLSEFRSIIRAYVPGAKLTVVKNPNLDLLINKGVDDVTEYGGLLPKEEKFDAKADQLRYTISSIISDFLTMDKPGLWWNNGSTTSPEWKRLDPRTKKWLDRYQENWRESDSGDPKYYAVEPNEFIIFPVTASDLTEGFWASFIAIAPKMTTTGNYPFSGTDTEFTQFRPLDDAIIDYVRWKLSRFLGKTAKGVITQQDYLVSRREKIKIVQKRLDIIPAKDTKWRIPTIGSLNRSSRR